MRSGLQDPYVTWFKLIIDNGPESERLQVGCPLVVTLLNLVIDGHGGLAAVLRG